MNNDIKLPTDYQNFIALSRYARWLEEDGRRETWTETVNRYVQYMVTHVSKKHNLDLSVDLQDKIFSNIANLNVMPRI
jgi:ribonucleoside-triphosphate reductase